MATFTVQNVLNRAKLACPSLNEQSDGITYFNEVDREIRLRAQIGDEAETVTTLAVGTREYDLDEDTLRVWSARYQKSATVSDYDVLSPTTIGELEVDEPNYLKTSNGTPRRFYVAESSASAMTIGLHPAPDTASTGSPAYPRLVLRVTRSIDVANWTAAGTTTLPKSIVSYDAWVMGVCAKWARDFGDERAPMWEDRFEREIKKLQHQRDTKNPQAPKTILTRAARRSRTYRV